MDEGLCIGFEISDDIDVALMPSDSDDHVFCIEVTHRPRHHAHDDAWVTSEAHFSREQAQALIEYLSTLIKVH